MNTQREWMSDTNERKTLNRFEWRKLNYRRRYDRALANVLMQLERETNLCGLFKGCRVVSVGCKKRSVISVEIRHEKYCLAERMKSWPGRN